jgi:mannose-1-phosphate guanylyltransferase
MVNNVNEFEHLYVVILAGGTGTRLWPRSRRNLPKQLLDLVGSRTMLQETFARIAPLVPADHVLVVTNTDLVDTVGEQLPDVPHDNVIGEPDARNTAPSIGLASVILRERDHEAVMASLASDHHIEREEEFRNALKIAYLVARKNFLVTLGIKPTHAETGYGYIQRGTALGEFKDTPVFRVQRFTEKPNSETAERMIASGDYFWNAGIVIARVETWLAEFARHQPQIYDGLLRIADAWGKPAETSTLARVYPTLSKVPIDTAVLDLLEADGNKNVVVGEHISIDSNSVFIYSPHRLIATIGLENMIVVDTGDVLLICPKDRAQEVKRIVEELQKQKKDQYL